ncbi:MAG: MBL fold metallo-hydrolase [Gammaproteobacteria bacterium]|nr:MBL fold metallo-hydrolase [Gammaproteobacteria bacterium]
MIFRSGIVVLLSITTFMAYGQVNYEVRGTVQNCVNVREEPRTSASSVGCLSANTNVIVTETVPFWRKITFDNNEGWIAKKFIIPTEQPPAPQTDRWLEVHFVDVGQGDAIWIVTPDDGIDGNGRFEGLNIVIDGGPYSADDSNPLLPYLESRGHHGAVIDALIVTHPHVDHYRGAETLVRHFVIDHYYDPGFPATQIGYNAFVDSLTSTETAVNNIHRGMNNFGVLDWGSELNAEILYSWPGVNTGLGSGSTRDNNTSIVLKLTYGNQSFLFMGDAEGKTRTGSVDNPKYVEKMLLDQNVDLSASVLKIAHHGSETSSTTDFISAVSPEIVVVQSGRKCFNGRQLPDMTTLQRYCDSNSATRFYRTDHNDESLLESDAVNGDHIVFRTNGQMLEVLSGAESNCSNLPAQVPMPQC